MSSLTLHNAFYTASYNVDMCWNDNLRHEWIPGDGHYATPGFVTSGILQSTFPPVRVNEHTDAIEFLETPHAEYAENPALKPSATALPEQWPFNHPHFQVTLPIPESVMNAFAYKAVLLELYVGITPSVDGNSEKKTWVDPQIYRENASIWDFQVDVGRIASLASVALLQRLFTSGRQLRYKALIYMIMYAPFPQPSFDVTFRLVCETSNAVKDVVYHHHVFTDYVLSSMGLNQRVRIEPPVGWSFLSDEDASEEDGSQPPRAT